ncbi:MAG: ABC transporter ATP-binding protein [Acidobacteria bacterium]|nr:MAG: ABC transporter ATP-binding protein [Acidobacteriota bacterium]
MALIELGSGFHPELTGRENVYLSGAILGMRRREVTAKLDSIVEFAGVAEFIDVPVKWYSSGMYVRLGFAIAAHLEMDILLVDEVLAVGDAAFQAKCFARIAELKRDGATILLISHDLAAVERLCSRAVLLDHGRAVLIGQAREVVATYQRVVEGAPVDAAVGRTNREDAEILSIEITDRESRPVASMATGAPALARIRYAAKRELTAPRFDLFFYGFEDGTLQSQCRGEESEAVQAGEGTAEFELPALGLQPGVYTLGATMTERGAPAACAWSYGRATLYVSEGRGLQGRFYMPFVFRHRPPEPAPARRVG